MNDNQKTKTKTKTTTIAAMIVIATIIASPLTVNKHAFAATTTLTAGPTMFKLTTPNAPVVIPLVKGLYDGKDILLITTEVSDKAMKDQIGRHHNVEWKFLRAEKPLGLFSPLMTVRQSRKKNS